MEDKESKTEKESYIEERIFGDHHYKTTISDGQHKAEGRGRTSEEAEKRASDKWDKGETSDSSCFITTTCVIAQGLPDTCEELLCLRQFRDEFVGHLPNGDKLIKEYNEKAPLIISAINKIENSKNIYELLFNKLVTKTVRLIKFNKNREALKNCILIIRDLEQRYL